MNHDEDWSVMGAIREWADQSARALKCIEILAARADMTPQELMLEIEKDDA